MPQNYDTILVPIGAFHYQVPQVILMVILSMELYFFFLIRGNFQYRYIMGKGENEKLTHVNSGDLDTFDIM